MYLFDNLGIVKDILAEEIDLPQERQHGFLIHWEGNLRDCPNPIWVYLNTTLSNDVAQDITLRHCKDTFLGI